MGATGKFSEGWNALAYVQQQKFGVFLVNFKLYQASKLPNSISSRTISESETVQERLEVGKVYIARFKIACETNRVVLHEYDSFGSKFGKILLEESQKIVALGLITKTFKEYADITRI